VNRTMNRNVVGEKGPSRKERGGGDRGGPQGQREKRSDISPLTKLSSKKSHQTKGLPKQRNPYRERRKPYQGWVGYEYPLYRKSSEKSLGARNRRASAKENVGGQNTSLCSMK